MRRSTPRASAGASYADVRVGRYRRQTINTRERQVTGVSDTESYGIGVRTLDGRLLGIRRHEPR